MNYYETHQDLFHLFGGYLNQNWESLYNWQGNKPSYQNIVRKYKIENNKEIISKTISQLKNVLKVIEKTDKEECFNLLAVDLGLGFYPPAINKTYQEWLEEALKILEEPMEETFKHWIPKRIRE